MFLSKKHFQTEAYNIYWPPGGEDSCLIICIYVYVKKKLKSLFQTILSDAK